MFFRGSFLALKMAAGIKRFGWLVGILPKSFLASGRCGQIEELLHFGLAALRINCLVRSE
jgi:hypothetical protein